MWSDSIFRALWKRGVLFCDAAAWLSTGSIPGICRNKKRNLNGEKEWASASAWSAERVCGYSCGIWALYTGGKRSGVQHRTAVFRWQALSVHIQFPYAVVYDDQRVLELERDREGKWAGRMGKSAETQGGIAADAGLCVDGAGLCEDIDHQ